MSGPKKSPKSAREGTEERLDDAPAANDLHEQPPLETGVTVRSRLGDPLPQPGDDAAANLAVAPVASAQTSPPGQGQPTESPPLALPRDATAPVESGGAEPPFEPDKPVGVDTHQTQVAQATVKPTPVSERTIGRYTINELLGSGGQGEVYLADDPLLERRVAIKSMLQSSGETLKRFTKEARLAARLDHPNVCRVYDVINDGTSCHIVMEYVEGASLFELCRFGWMKQQQALPILLQVARGLTAAHQQNIVHRDLKTENVVVTTKGIAKITDFGIAHQNTQEHHKPQNNEAVLDAGLIIGTARAMSPEQTLCKPADTRSDLFSFGVLCYEVLCKKSPFLASTQVETLRRVREYLPRAPISVDRTIPERLSALVQRLLSKRAADRPETAALVTVELERIRAQGERTRTPAPLSGERRQLTLLSCELALRESNDAEDAEVLLDERQDFRISVESSLDRFSGAVHSVYGNSYLACFGYPIPLEDTARRALSAAQEIRTAIEQNENTALTTRFGIHSGVGVSTDQDTVDELELGRLPAVANQLRDNAPDGGILVSDATRQLLEDSVTFGEPSSLRSGRRQITANHVIAVEGDRGVLENTGEGPLFGRTAELSLLTQACKQALNGSGRVIVISGEPGIGKSRLVRAVHDELSAYDHRWVVGEASPEADTAPLQPVVGIVRQVTGISASLTPERQQQHCRTWLTDHDLPLSEHLTFLCSLFEIPVAEEFRLPPWVTPDLQRSLMLESTATMLCVAAAQRPYVLLLEDLHWLDASTLSFLAFLVEQSQNTSLAVVITTRPEGEPQWSESHVTRVSLGPLATGDAASLIDDASPTSQLEPELRARIVRRAAGNPLFLEQMARTAEYVADASTGLPPSLRELLAARLHGLGKARETAQVAAVIGRNFETRMLCEAMSRPEVDVEETLAQLASHAIVQRRRGAGNQAVWMFKHALIRDAAYESLIARRRKELHALVRRAFETVSPEVRDQRPQILAYHSQEAGYVEDAISLWRASADKASAASAQEEAFQLYHNALTQLALTAASDERHGRELELRVLAGVAALGAKGYGADAVEECFRRADELCQILGHYPFPVFYGIWAVYLMRGDAEKTRAKLKYIEELLPSTEDDTVRLMAYNCLATFDFWAAEPRSSNEGCKRCIAAFTPELQRASVKTYGGSGGYYGHLIRPYVSVSLGEVERSEQEQATALELAATFDPYTIAETHNLAVWRAFELERVADVARLNQTVVDLSEKFGYAMHVALGQIASGWVMLRQEPDSATEALALVERGCATYRAMGMNTALGFWMSWKADVLEQVGQFEQSLLVVEETLASVRAHFDKLYESDLTRRRGVLLRLLGRAEEGRKALLEARTLAERRGQLWFQLKAQLCLAEFANDPDEIAAARRLYALCRIPDTDAISVRVNTL